MIRKFLLRLLFRLFAKRSWKPGLRMERLRGQAATVDSLISRISAAIPVQAVAAYGVPSEWVGDAASAERGALLYLHGGAFCLHLPACYRQHASELAQRTGLRVLLPDYRLAPEFPFPAGLDDCCAAYRWLLDQGVASQQIAIAGDSAGGNLVLATLMRLQRAGLPLPCCAVVLSPLTDFSGSSPSMVYNERSDWIFTHEATTFVRNAYVQATPLDDPQVSPLFGDWRGLPPLLFQASSSEMLLCDTVRAAERARAAGVTVKESIWLDLPHVFQVLRWLPETQRALDEIAVFVRAHHPAPAPAAAGAATLPAR